jgi:Uncharacterized protein conserved in bacteria
MAGGFGRALEKMGWRVPADPAEENQDEVEDYPFANAEHMSFSERVYERPEVPVAPVEAVENNDESRQRIATIHPKSYADVVPVGESFRSGVPVIMNLTGMDDGEARRVVDFAAGLTFGLRGSIERVTSRVFLLSPADVHVSRDGGTRMSDGFR